MDVRARIASLEQELETGGADVGRVRLKLGDAYRELATEHYLAGVEHLQAMAALAVVRQCVLLMPARRDLRRMLADRYSAFGLVDDARAELTTLLEQCKHAGIEDEIVDARRRLAALPPINA